MISLDHPAVEAASKAWAESHTPTPATWAGMSEHRRDLVRARMVDALKAALPHLTAERDAYREENTRLREQAARVKALADRLDAEAADDFDGVSGTSVSLVKYETAKAIRAALNGETNG